jgi:hypothetical protein
VSERAWPTQSARGAAETAIGDDDPHRDWDLQPEAHANTLPPEAGALKRVLQSPEIKHIMQRYSECDREAVRQQARYRRALNILLVLAYSTALSGLFASSVHLILTYVPDIQPLLVLIHLALLLGLALVAAWVNRAIPREKWLAARGEAEQLRVALFDHVLAADQAVEDAELPLLPLKLAYFRRYQLDIQLRYMGGRGTQLARTVGLPLWLTLAMIAIAIFVAGFGLAFLAHVADEYGLPVPDWILLATRMESAERTASWAFPLLALSTVYAFMLSQRRGVSEEARAGTRYLAIFKNLNFLKEAAYEEVRRRAEDGDRATVASFVGLVHGLMIAEQSQWISFQSLVDHKDALLAGGSAAGLTKIFSGQFAVNSEPKEQNHRGSMNAYQEV